jgi:hypothetical protein
MNDEFKGKIFYRVVYSTDYGIKYIKWYETKETKHGYWITDRDPKWSLNILSSQGTKFILKLARRRYARDTKQRALIDFAYRKTKQLYILDSMRRVATCGLKVARDLLKDDDITIPDWAPKPVYCYHEDY